MCIMLYPQKIQTEFGLMYTDEYIIFYKLYSISFDVKWCEQVKLSMNPNSAQSIIWCYFSYKKSCQTLLHQLLLLLVDMSISFTPSVINFSKIITGLYSSPTSWWNWETERHWLKPTWIHPIHSCKQVRCFDMTCFVVPACSSHSMS